MKLIGNILVWVFLAAGLIAATSFYVWPVGSDPAADQRFQPAAGDDGTPTYARLLNAVTDKNEEEIAPPDAELNPETLALIREAGVKRIIVKHPTGAYSRMIANWTGKWLFLGSALGLVLGAVLLRADARLRVRAADRSGSPTASPEEIAGQIRAAIADLRASLPAIESRRSKELAIVAALGEVQADLVPAFVDTRPILIGKRGMGGFAAVMDKFAGMERQMNRAWSAAADEALEESLEALDNAAILADDFAKLMGIG